MGPDAEWPEPLEKGTKILMCRRCSKLPAESMARIILWHVRNLRTIRARREAAERN